MQVCKVLSFGQNLTSICTSMSGNKKVSFSEYKPPAEDKSSRFEEQKEAAKNMMKISWVCAVTAVIFWFAAKR